MIDFLRSSPLPNLNIVRFRAEEYYRRDYFDVVTGRALAALSVQLELSAPLSKVGGLVIPLRTPNDHNEIERFRYNKLGLSLESVHRIQLVPIDAERIFPIFRKSEPTPKKFPRKWAEIRNKPL
jgi:16S rRNA (guanine527-N7)-methyltransferase